MIPKITPWRSKAYRQYVSSLPCKLCGYPESTAHHLIGVPRTGIMGGKVPDWMTMPLCEERGCHSQMHKDSDLKQKQWRMIIETLEEAFEHGVIGIDVR